MPTVLHGLQSSQSDTRQAEAVEVIAAAVADAATLAAEHLKDIRALISRVEDARSIVGRGGQVEPYRMHVDGTLGTLASFEFLAERALALAILAGNGVDARLGHEEEPGAAVLTINGESWVWQCDGDLDPEPGTWRVVQARLPKRPEVKVPEPKPDPKGRLMATETDPFVNVLEAGWFEIAAGGGKNGWFACFFPRGEPTEADRSFESSIIRVDKPGPYEVAYDGTEDRLSVVLRPVADRDKD